MLEKKLIIPNRAQMPQIKHSWVWVVPIWAFARCARSCSNGYNPNSTVLYLRHLSTVRNNLFVKQRMVLEGRLRRIHSRQRSRNELIFASSWQLHALFDDNSQQRKNISILTWYIKENRHRCNVFQRNILQRTSTEVNVYMRRHQTRPFARTTWIIVVWSR